MQSGECWLHNGSTTWHVNARDLLVPGDLLILPSLSGIGELAALCEAKALENIQRTKAGL